MTSSANLPSPWLRLIARIVDSVIVGIPTAIVFALIAGSAAVGGAGVSANSFSTDWGIILAGLVSGLIALGYEYYFLAKDGATPGKKLLSLKVIREDGSPLGSDGAMRRLILAAIGYLPFVGGFFGFAVLVGTIIMIFADDRRQVPADKVANSIVVKA